MGLTVRQREVPHGIAEPVARQTVRTQDGVVIRDRERRVVLADQGALCRRLVLDFTKGVQAAFGILFEQVDPTLKSFLARQGSRLNVGYATELIKRLVFHRSPPCLEPRTQKWTPFLGSIRCSVLNLRIVGRGNPGPLVADADLWLRTVR